jgi:phosphatidylglycerol lysyltransferase
MTRRTPNWAAAQDVRAATLSRALPLRQLRLLLPLGIGLACLWLLQGRLSTLDMRAVTQVITTTHPAQWLAAAGATALSFWAIGTYDAVMHRHLRTGVPPRVARITGAGSVAIAQVLGLGLLTGALARWRMLPGARPGMAAAVTAAVSGSFLAAWALLASVAAIAVPAIAMPGLGILLIVGACLALPVLAFRHPVLRWRRWSLRLPTLRALGAMTLLAALDILAAATALHVLMPGHLSVDFLLLLPVFTLAIGAGLFSSTPGGAGPFELTLLACLPAIDQEALLGAVLAWRVIYYAIPALLALIPLARPFAVTARLPCTARPDAAALSQASRAECGVARQNGAELLSSGTDSAIVVETGQSLTLLFDAFSGRGDASMLHALRSEAAERTLVPAIYKCSAPLATTARAEGWHVLHIADEAVIDPQRFSLDGSQHRQLRRKLRHAAKARVTVSEACPRDATLHRTLAAIDRHWVSRHGTARGLSMGRFDPEYIAGQRLFLAWQAGRIIAFVTFHEARDEMTLDLMRHGPGQPDGVMQALIAAGIVAAQKEGRMFSLAALPARPGGEGPILARLRKWQVRLTGSDGLIRFKEAFAPRRKPLYLAAPTLSALTLAAVDLARAIQAPEG